MPWRPPRLLRGIALMLAEEDAAAFDKVTDAYKLPRATDEEKAARTAAIQASLIDAAGRAAQDCRPVPPKSSRWP